MAYKDSADGVEIIDMDIYEPVIGLEIHAELATKSKMFCGCPSDHFGKAPNTQTCPVCLGLPGALPVPNKKAVEWTILLGLALNGQIREVSKFDRKHYFYPDLPKGYQISQYDQPIATRGSLELTLSIPQPRVAKAFAVAQSGNPIMIPDQVGDDRKKTIRIRRVHLEEDTGKLMHEQVNGRSVTLVDFNRSGVALVEIVTEPDFRSIEEVDQFVKKIQQILRYLGISGADMEKGTMRIEPSVSVRQASSNDMPSYRVELKNINSFRFVRRSIEFEIARQTEEFKQGHVPTQQTRGWIEAKGVTVVQREKEEAHDYRYFPEPDIPPLRFTEDQIAEIKNQIGELPDAKRVRFIHEYGLSEYDAGILTETRETAHYFEDAVKQAVNLTPSTMSKVTVTPKTIANWIINKNIDREKTPPIKLIEHIVAAGSIASLSESDLTAIIKNVLTQNTKAVADYKAGKEQALMYLVGHVMRETKGKCSAESARKLMVEIIGKQNL